MADDAWIDGLRRTVEIWSVPVCVAAGGMIVAYAAEKVLHARLVAYAERTAWKGGQVVARAARGMAFIWLTLVILVVSANNAPISDANRKLLEHAVSVLWVLSATTVAARALSGAFRVHASTLESFGSTSIFSNMISLGVYGIGLLMVFQTLGISIGPILGALGIGGLAVALALQDTLSNLFAGIHIIVARHVRPGDYVRMDTGDEGHVIDIGWRNTTVRSMVNNLVVVPNSKLAAAVVTNYSLPEKLLVMKVPVGVAYGSDLRHVERVMLEVAAEVLPPPAGDDRLLPAVRYHTFADSSINADVLLPVKEFAEQNAVKHEFVIRLHERFRREGIDIPCPVRAVHILPSPDHPGSAPPAPAST